MEIVWDVPNRKATLNGAEVVWSEVKPEEVAVWRSLLALRIGVYLRVQKLIEKWESGNWPSYSGAADTIASLMNENNIAAGFLFETCGGIKRWVSTPINLLNEDLIEFCRQWGEKAA